MGDSHGNINHAMRDNYDQFGVDEVCHVGPVTLFGPSRDLILPSTIAKSRARIATRFCPLSSR